MRVIAGRPVSCKVAIGSKYEGPSLDRPCLRRMPSHWSLSNAKPRRNAWWMFGDRFVAIVAAVIALIAVGIEVGRFV